MLSIQITLFVVRDLYVDFIATQNSAPKFGALFGLARRCFHSPGAAFEAVPSRGIRCADVAKRSNGLRALRARREGLNAKVSGAAADV